MKQFILKNIVLVAILALTLVSSIFLIFFIWGKSQTIKDSMNDIEADVEKLESINSARKPNSVEQSEKMIKADTETLNKKNVQIYRHFGRPYRPALLKLLKNIASPAELKTELKTDPTLVAKPKPKPDIEPSDDDEEEEVTEVASSEPSAPTDEEKAVFNPSANVVVLSYDEDAMRAILAELYKEIPQETSDDENFVIPDTIQPERAQLFDKLFNRIIEAPDVVDPSRAEAFRTAAAAKFAQAFALFREEVQELTLEDVTYDVAHELFLDALGLPRLMRQRDCKNYVDILYEKYLTSNIIPGLPSTDLREDVVQDFIYGKNLNRQALPVPDMVIPILRNFQIKEDLFRRMNDSGIKKLDSMSVLMFYGSNMTEDSEAPILQFTYTLEMIASLEAIDKFINSLHTAYKTDRVYVIKDIRFSSPSNELADANSVVFNHIAAQAEAEQSAQEVAAAFTSDYEINNPQHPDYGRVLIGEARDNIRCTITVNYLVYRADNITPQ